MSQEHTTYYQSAIGLLEIIGTEQGVKEVRFAEAEPPDEPAAEVHPCLQECVRQLDEYFKGERQEFSLELVPDGTAFQQKIWQQLLTIPYGKTVSYLDIARAAGDEKAVRAVGNANGRNKIVIIMPCHRVIGSNGQLTGYGGGLWRKEWLLDHERSISVGKQMRLL
jgi:methylated-DNA-[protein]-cysteine S-methyltransferase